jgi:hypothetical protein
MLVRTVSVRSGTETVAPRCTRQQTCRRRPPWIATSDRGTGRVGEPARSALAVRAGKPPVTRPRARRTPTGRALSQPRAAARTRSPALPWRPLDAPHTQLVDNLGNTTSVAGLEPASSGEPHTAGTSLPRPALRHDDSQTCTKRHISTGRIGQMPPTRRQTERRALHSRLLDGSGRTGVRPDSVQAFGGTLASRLPTWTRCGSLSVCVPVVRRVEAWLHRGLPSS